MLVRPATLLDLPELRRLWEGLAAMPRDIPYPTVGLQDAATFVEVMALMLSRREQQPTPTLFAEVAERPDGRLAGFLAAEVSQRLLGEPKTFITGHFFYVDPDVRKAGVGRQLAEAGIAWARHLGVGYVELMTHGHRKDWERRGWTSFGEHYMVSIDAMAQALLAAPPTDAVEGVKETDDAVRHADL